MSSRSGVIVLIAGLVVVVGLFLAAGQGYFSDQQIYTVAQVQAGRQRHPRDWIGRTVLVRGGLTGYGMKCGLHAHSGCRARWEPLQQFVTCAHPSPMHGCEYAQVLYPFLLVQRGTGFAEPWAIRQSPMQRLLVTLSRLPLLRALVPTRAWQTDPFIYRVRLVRAQPCPPPPTARPCIDAVVL